MCKTLNDEALQAMTNELQQLRAENERLERAKQSWYKTAQKRCEQLRTANTTLKSTPSRVQHDEYRARIVELEQELANEAAAHTAQVDAMRVDIATLQESRQSWLESAHVAANERDTLQEMLDAKIVLAKDTAIGELLDIINAHAGHEHYEAALQLIGADEDISAPDEPVPCCAMCNKPMRGGTVRKTELGALVAWRCDRHGFDIRSAEPDDSPKPQRTYPDLPYNYDGA